MKKISNSEIAALIIITTITMYSGINYTIIKNNVGTNIWITIILSNIIGIIPVLLFLYLSNYKQSISLHQKINSLYKHLGPIINLILYIIILIVGITILYNISNFITSQLLYRTPQLAITIIFMLLIIYHTNKGINSITKVSILLTAYNIILFILSLFSLSVNIKISNYLPIIPNINIIPNAIKLASIIYLPSIIILNIPKNKVTNPDNYNKDIIKAYLIGSIIPLIITLVTYGSLGEYLFNIYEYPEYIVLKKVIFFGSLERIENIIYSQWIVASYVYITYIIYYLTNTSPLKKKIKSNYISIIIGIIIITTTILIFKNNTIYHNYLKNIFPYITSTIFIIYLILIIKIFIDKKSTN